MFYLSFLFTFLLHSDPFFHHYIFLSVRSWALSVVLVAPTESKPVVYLFTIILSLILSHCSITLTTGLYNVIGVVLVAPTETLLLQQVMAL